MARRKREEERKRIERRGEIDEPSVILLHPRYNTPTDAVSSTVAIKLPSTRWFEAYINYEYGCSGRRRYTYLADHLSDKEPYDLGDDEKECRKAIEGHRSLLVEEANDDVRHEDEIDDNSTGKMVVRIG